MAHVVLNVFVNVFEYFDQNMKTVAQMYLCCHMLAHILWEMLWHTGSEQMQSSLHGEMKIVFFFAACHMLAHSLWKKCI